MITEDVLNRILAERDRAHASEIARLESEHKAQSLEFRLSAIEKKLEEEEKDEGGGIGGMLAQIPPEAYATIITNLMTSKK